MKLKVLSAALTAALMVAGLYPAQAQETLKIGGVGPLSGGGTAWGLAAQRGMEIAIEEINAAGGVKAADPRNEVTVYTEFEDVGYSPCGIPYVHGKEIDSFERLFLAQKEAYVQAGIDVHYETWVSSIESSRVVTSGPA